MQCHPLGRKLYSRAAFVGLLLALQLGRAESQDIQLAHRGETFIVYVPGIGNPKKFPTEENPQGRADLRIALTALPRTSSKPLVAISQNGIYEFPRTKRGLYLIELYKGDNLLVSESVDTNPMTPEDSRSAQKQTPDEAQALFRTPPLPNAVPEALNCAQLQSARTVWYGYVDKPLVEMRLLYRNICDRTVRMQQVVSSGHQPRNSAPSDLSQWNLYETRVIHFMLKPDEDREVTQTLRWFRLESTIPRLNHRSRSAAFVD